MEAAQELVALTRTMNRIDSVMSVLLDRAKKCKSVIEHHIEEGDFPQSAKVAGANVHLQTQIWASPVNGNHSALAEVLDELGLVEYLPKTVNSQSLSSYVRNEMDPDKEKSLEERLATLDPRLRQALKVTEKHQVKVTGA